MTSSMYLIYLLPFLLINPAHTWFKADTSQVEKSINPPIDCVNFLSDQLYTFEKPITGVDWNYGDIMKNIDNINCAVMYSNSDKIVFVDDNFKKYASKTNIHHMNIVPSFADDIFNLLKEHNKTFVIEKYYPEPNFFLSWIVYLFSKIFLYLWYFILLRGVMRILYVLYHIHKIDSKENFISKESKNDNSNSKTFDDVAGCDEAKEELQEVVEFLKNPEAFEDAGAKIPAGVLLEGPPGTGKTLLAKATATEADVNFVYANGSEFIEMYVGVGASRVRKLFETAQDHKPCIVFIDEIDAIGAARSNGHGRNDERDQTLNQLLTLMDGFQTKDGIIVLAATNRSEILDPALTRNGRFDRKVTVGLPDRKGRKQILNVHLENKTLAKNCNLDSVYELTTGFSGAELANLANEAAILSVRYKLPHITEKCFIDAFEKNTIGLPKKEDNRPKDNIKMVAYHEGGHTLAALYFKHIFDVRRVTINANNTGAGGYTLFTPKEEFVQFPTKRYMLANIIISLGGRAAEIILHKEKNNKLYKYDESVIFKDHFDLDITTGASNDLKQANRLARGFVTKYGLGENIGIYDNDDHYNNKLSDYSKERIDKEIEKLIDNALKMALKIIEGNRNSLDKLSELLIDFTTVNENQLEEKLEIKYDLDNDTVYP